MSVAFVFEPPRNRSGSENDEPEAPHSGRPVPLEHSPSEGAPIPRTLGRVLVAEDNAGIRESLRELLEHAGYEVAEAREGSEALFLLAPGTVDVLILDLAMPVHDGMWLLDRLGPAMPPVIVYSALEYITEAELQARAGSKVFRVLRKPVSPSELLAAVADAIGENRS